MTTRFEHLDELPQHVGRALGTSDWIGVTQARIDQFAAATGDAQWIHVDAARAAAGPFGTTIAHGFLTLALLPAFFDTAFEIGDSVMGLNYGLNRVRFIAPVPVDSRLRAQFRLLACDAIEGGLQLAVEASIEREGSPRPVCVAEALVRHYR